MGRRSGAGDRVDFLAVTPAVILRAENVALHFDSGATKALDGVDIAIREGEFVAIVGPSGCGKSSLLNVLGTLESPTAGALFFHTSDFLAELCGANGSDVTGRASTDNDEIVGHGF